MVVVFFNSDPLVCCPQGPPGASGEPGPSGPLGRRVSVDVCVRERERVFVGLVCMPLLLYICTDSDIFRDFIDLYLF